MVSSDVILDRIIKQTSYWRNNVFCFLTIILIDTVYQIEALNTYEFF